MNTMRIFITIITVAFCCFITCSVYAAQNYSIGVYYYPGWQSNYVNWKDIKGLPGSRSPGKAWPDREPVLGYYPEEEPWVAEKHIDWASQYGITFFAYDWYWVDNKPAFDHALKNYLKAKNKNKLQFSLLWAYHTAVLKDLNEFNNVVDYWINNYFNQPTYYKIMGKPAVFIYDLEQLENNARVFHESTKSLLAKANKRAIEKGYKGIYFVLTTNAKPNDDLEGWLSDTGFSAYTGWNYVESLGGKTEDYDVMVKGYLDNYLAASNTMKRLTYIASASPGWDSRPWAGNTAPLRTNPTPDKFAQMLIGAKKLMDSDNKIPKILMIEAWNEFGEGSYIEPTKYWGFSYLETIKKVFGSPSPVKQKRK
jgi:hypothetical protein